MPDRSRGAAITVVSLSACLILAGCNRDDAPDSLAAGSTAVGNTTSPAPTRPAPTGGAAGDTKAPAGTSGAAGTRGGQTQPGGATPAGGAAPTGGRSGGAAPAATPGTFGGDGTNRVAATDPDAAELNAARRLYTVQVGSFANQQNATGMRDRLMRIGIPVWLVSQQVGDREYTRVRIGVTLTAAEAEALAAKIRGLYNWPTWVTLIEDRSALPAGWLTLTRDWTA